ncbi:hypothetical protein [Floccifex sp.]|uniref:hypothetical protein n=1 Tax=Floccifex sp. TaxID=2815810 RepID=UPI002A7481B5|nr:hypothetical protein [Floccifex sp.]MDD7282213.1 hypothetical protein [Erysipelotrichaceae bacterium]MDY2957738.1 hypothetical protein [Floccifex sp.]
MKKNNMFIETLLIVISLVIAIVSFVLFLMNKIDQNTMYIICGIAIVCVLVLLYFKNRKINRYDGRFKDTYGQ